MLCFVDPFLQDFPPMGLPREHWSPYLKQAKGPQNEEVIGITLFLPCNQGSDYFKNEVKPKQLVHRLGQEWVTLTNLVQPLKLTPILDNIRSFIGCMLRGSHMRFLSVSLIDAFIYTKSHNAHHMHESYAKKTVTKDSHSICHDRHASSMKLAKFESRKAKPSVCVAKSLGTNVCFSLFAPNLFCEGGIDLKIRGRILFEEGGYDEDIFEGTMECGCTCEPPWRGRDMHVLERVCLCVDLG